MNISFFVPGDPKSQGSKDQFGRESCKLLPAWRSLVSLMAKNCMCAVPPTSLPVYVQIRFSFPRPKSHFGTGKNREIMRPGSPTHKTSKPDVDKLVRAVLDAGTGIIWNDDSCVCRIDAEKIYGNTPGAQIKCLSM